MACGPRCFRCRYEMPSGPVDVVCFVLRMASTVMAVLKGGGRLWFSVVLCRRRRMFLSACLGVSLHVVE